MKTSLKIAAAATAFAVGGMIGPAIAPADASPSQDVTFLDLLTSHGLSYQSADAAIQQGHAVCDALDSGLGVPAVWNTVYQALPVTRDQALSVVAASVVAYCPWHMPAGTTARHSLTT